MTLLEVMVALVIILVMSVAIFSVLSTSIEFHSVLEARDDTTRGARVALSTLQRSLQLAYLTPNRMQPDRIQTVFVGIDQDPDVLYFATLAHKRLYMNTRESDQGEVTVFAEDAPKELGPGKILYWRESGLVDEEPGDGGTVVPLAYHVRTFNLRYLDQATDEWKDDWDTRSSDTPYLLPRAVEISLVLIAPDPDEPDGTVDVPFLATVPLHYANPLVNSQYAAAQQMIAAANAAAGNQAAPGAGSISGLSGIRGGPQDPGPCGTGVNGLCSTAASSATGAGGTYGAGGVRGAPGTGVGGGRPAGIGGGRAPSSPPVVPR
jgi:general secretion pathway protein J